MSLFGRVSEFSGLIWNDMDQEKDVDQLEDGYSRGMSIWKAVAPEVFVCWKM